MHAYEQWGEDAFSHLRGMFAHRDLGSTDAARCSSRATASASSRSTTRNGHGGLSFGSEIKSLLASGRSTRDRSSPAALDHYLSFLYTPRRRHRSSVASGSCRRPSAAVARRTRLSVRRYWQLPAEESFAGSIERGGRATHATVLADAVRSHLVSDVPLGAFLSGGVDSSLVVGLMARASSRPVKTFSIGFDEPAFDELDAARRVAAALRHRSPRVRRRAGCARRSSTAWSRISTSRSAIPRPFPTWYVSRDGARHVTVVLSGDGGDELFGGYDRYLPHPRVASFDSLLGGRRTEASPARRGRSCRTALTGKNFLRHVAQGRSRPLSRLDQVLPAGRDGRRSCRAELGDRDRRRSAEPPAGRSIRTIRARCRWPSQMMRFDLDTYLPEDILTKVDRMSMAHSIESRVPLLDHEVVDVRGLAAGAS